MKPFEIVYSFPPQSELNNTILSLGGFHLIMSFLGWIGKIMVDSGLEELLSVVYAENFVGSILAGHAYARSIRPHTSTN